MANVNKVFLIGNLTRDPELRYTPNGTAVASFGLATTRKYRAQSGEQQEETCFVEVEVWARRAEVMSEYLSKGRPVFIEGRLRLDTWETPQGDKRSRMKVVVENFQFLGGRRAASGEREDLVEDEPREQKAKSDEDDIPF